MKNLFKITTVLFLLVQTNGFSQTKETIVEKDSTEIKIDTTKLKDFIGTYFLAEADFTLEIVQEDGKMYVISPFSKDILIHTNDTTLHELTRGVDLQLIKDNKDALKYTQNGYETTIKRVKSKTKD